MSSPQKGEQGEQYFSATPHSEDRRRVLTVNLRGHTVKVEVSNGVFSAAGLDKGTAVLLKEAPTPPREGTFLDLGCGWGPLTLALGFESPQATIWAVDVNDRAVELTRRNASAHGLSNVSAVTEHELPESTSFDLIWSNPPIRIGKEPLHQLLMSYIPRLTEGGRAYLVVQKHLGSDSLITWLSQTLGTEFAVSRYAISKGFRIIEVARSTSHSTQRITEETVNE
ncbi:MAG: class I SAM-dependent methyltransferase [Bifidobacteriaceae bacterium]|jgi:16S rRNA G1207 methylase RsmC|nr:class I SAM-dependent methyltransferase [Bifidobacteriaceae bacterium]MCI1979058.1 class I SAM-dependent methyltransferase [Bifidobacteriaceae bacterium]